MTETGDCFVQVQEESTLFVADRLRGRSRGLCVSLLILVELQYVDSEQEAEGSPINE